MTLRGHPSYWASDNTHAPSFPTLEGNVTTDVVVVGGGITGLTAAWRLRELGRAVTVLEMNRVAGGTTAYSTGHLDVTTDRYLQTIARDFGEAAARRLVVASQEAIEFVERMSGLIDGSDFRRVPSYLYTEDTARCETIQREWECDKGAELHVEMAGAAPLPFPTVSALRIANQARFNPGAYTRGLAQRCAEAGCSIVEGVRVKDIEGGPTCRVVTTRGIVTAKHVVVAVHGAMLGLVTLATRVYPYQSYVLGVRVNHDVPDALYWDTHDPYRYTRWAASEDPKLLLIGGADHRTGEQHTTDTPFSTLERYARDRYDVEQVEFRWSHELYESADGLPFIGRVPGLERIYIGTGYGGDGLKYGTVAGLLLADLACDRYNPATALFDPARITPRASARRMAAGLAHIAHRFIGDRIAPDEVDHLHDIPPDAGRILRVDGTTMAVYRDDEGGYHALSPVCTHAGCYVRWNAVEKTWDCPCHGGRYDAYGNVIAAPPRQDLRPIELPPVVPHD